MNPTKKEINALVDLLEQDWETPEELAKALVKALDEARTDRTTYVGVMVFGPHFAAAIGPYAGATSARNAVKKFPGATVAKQIAVIPLTSAEGVEQRLREVG
jgi:hypothetical protein